MINLDFYWFSLECSQYNNLPNNEGIWYCIVYMWVEKLLFLRVSVWLHSSTSAGPLYYQGLAPPEAEVNTIHMKQLPIIIPCLYVNSGFAKQRVIWFNSHYKGTDGYHNTPMWHFGPCVTFWLCQCHFLDLPMWLFGPQAVTCQWHSPHEIEIYRNSLEIKRDNKSISMTQIIDEIPRLKNHDVFLLSSTCSLDIFFTTFESGTVRFRCTKPVAKACWSITTRYPIV